MNRVMIRNIRGLLDRYPNQAAFAGDMGVTQATVSRWLKGQRPNDEHIRRMAKLAGTTVRVFLYGTSEDEQTLPEVPVVGYVGAGEAWRPVDDHAIGEGLEYVPNPPGTDSDDMVALRIRGDSMRPLRPGWLIFYSRHHDGVPPDAINNMCVVMTADGRGLVKQVRRGSRDGLYQLLSWSFGEDPIDDVELEWAAPVEAIVPR